MRQTGFFGKFMTKTFVFITTKNRPHFNTFQRLLHVMQLQNTVPVTFSKNISWCKHLCKLKLKSKDSITFHICNDMYYYISNILETFAPPQKKCNDPSEKAIIKITVDVNQLTWTFRRWEETLLFLNWTTKLSMAQVFTFSGQYNFSQFNPPLKVLIPPVNHE